MKFPTKYIKNSKYTPVIDKISLEGMSKELYNILNKSNLSRMVMYYNICKFLQEEKRTGKVLDVSGSENYLKFFTNPEIIYINYPENDIHKTNFEDNSFDWIILDQVLEHLEKPWNAIKEIHRILKPDGKVIITTCFLNPYHATPEDYFRYSVYGLKSITEDYFKNCLLWGGWGNSKFICNRIKYAGMMKQTEGWWVGGINKPEETTLPNWNNNLINKVKWINYNVI